MPKPAATFSNAQIATLLRNVAAVYALNGENIFRIKAFENAANSIEQYSIPVQDIWTNAEALDAIPGVGKAIASDLHALFTNGKIEHYDTLLHSVPQGFFALLPIQGIGPKTALKLVTQLNLQSAESAIEEVKRASKEQRIEKLDGFSAVSQARILSAIEHTREKAQARLLLPIAEQIASDVVAFISSCPAVLAAEPLGSLRRKSPTVGDIDIAVSTNDSATVFDHLATFPGINRLIGRGAKQFTFIHATGWQVDCKTSDPAAWGSMLQHYTGNKMHNIALRTIAVKKGWSLSERGIEKDGNLHTYATEELLYRELGMEWIPPMLREDSGEIVMATSKTLPNLVTLPMIKGDLHIHTNLPFPTSHDSGRSTIDDLLLRAKELNYAYIGFSDHNPKRTGLSASERLECVRERNESIDEVVARFFKGKEQTIKVYKGLEIDILPDGNLALEDEAIQELDYVIASLHSQFRQDRKTATARILKALSHPKVKWMGHPTGRILESRDGIDADWTEIFSFCAQQGIWMEINSGPDRTDLPAPLIREAKKAGVQFIINTDAHHVDGMDSMKYGIYNAQRGWASADDIVNTQSTLPL
ncbi:hypothetical protein KBD71_05110 [Candidatus Woesebacteria bacterium]|nr:hypothetical protein [Candidatus Woesebacteria bacterium]